MYKKEMAIDVYLAMTECAYHMACGSGKENQATEEWQKRIAKKYAISESAAISTMAGIGMFIVDAELAQNTRFTQAEAEALFVEHQDELEALMKGIV